MLTPAQTARLLAEAIGRGVHDPVLRHCRIIDEHGPHIWGEYYVCTGADGGPAAWASREDDR